VDTSVILAQPRENMAPSGGRLRGSVGLPRASSRSWITIVNEKTGSPQNWPSLEPFYAKKIPYSTVAFGAQKWILLHIKIMLYSTV